MPFGMTDKEFSILPFWERERLYRMDRPKVGILVKWNRDGTSKDGRFMIEGLPEGTSKNQSYNLYDYKDGLTNRKRISTSGSARQCKVEAERIVANEISNP